jgi:hypothetical protein
VLTVWLLAAGVSLWVGRSDERSGGRVPHLRPLDSLAGAAIEGGLGRSPTFASLVQTIEGSEFIVHVESSRKLRDGMKGCLVHGSAGKRYLRILLKVGLGRDERIEVLAHELQHVREVIQAGILNEPGAMDALFSRLGYNRHQQGERQQEYETEAARLIASMVARDLRANRRH